MRADLVIRYPGVSRASRVRIARGALAQLGSFTRATTSARRAALVSDSTVSRLHGPRALESLERAGIASALIAVPPGERSKRPAQLANLWEQLGALRIGRRDTVVALGGGVIGDLAGFAAATWLRGVSWVCVPTSLLAQVDSSVGGKTAVDLAAGKNLVGAFHQPVGVLIDPELLATLPRRELRAGLAEVVKTGMAVDGALFRWLEHQIARLAAFEPRALEGAVTRAIRAKALIVRADERERERGLRTALNYGHTLGHALEAVSGYRGLLHGEAVAIGMRVAAALSERVVGLSHAARLRQDALLDAIGLDRRMPPARLSALLSAMSGDKKRGESGVRWVLTPRIGDASVPRQVSGGLVRAALLEAGART